MSHMLDIDTCIYLMTDRDTLKQQSILAKLESIDPGEPVYLSSIVVSELSYTEHRDRTSWSGLES